MKILGLDCALSACSVALWADGAVRGREGADLARGQAEALVPMIARVMAATATRFADLDRLAVTIGPGHFTGLRAGLATARGLALAARLPLIGATTLDCVAAGVDAAERAPGRLIVALESKRAELYVQVFEASGAPRGAPLARRPEDLARALDGGPWLIAGDGGPRLAAALAAAGRAVVLSRSPGRPDAAILAALAAERPLPAHPPAPLYLHPPAAKPPTAARPAAG
ncbi:MAG: tRNA (adenosine(37)-N6)-threonylcarbamoyltransferase complex dimerization subunit type 1 TsaB [Pseudomonadota bacterium]